MRDPWESIIAPLCAAPGTSTGDSVMGSTIGSGGRTGASAALPPLFDALHRLLDAPEPTLDDPEPTPAAAQHAVAARLTSLLTDCQRAPPQGLVRASVRCVELLCRCGLVALDAAAERDMSREGPSTAPPPTDAAATPPAQTRLRGAVTGRSAARRHVRVVLDEVLPGVLVGGHAAPSEVAALLRPVFAFPLVAARVGALVAGALRCESDAAARAELKRDSLRRLIDGLLEAGVAPLLLHAQEDSWRRCFAPEGEPLQLQQLQHHHDHQQQQRNDSRLGGGASPLRGASPSSASGTCSASVSLCAPPAELRQHRRRLHPPSAAPTAAGPPILSLGSSPEATRALWAAAPPEVVASSSATATARSVRDIVAQHRPAPQLLQSTMRTAQPHHQQCAAAPSAAAGLSALRVMTNTGAPRAPARATIAEGAATHTGCSSINSRTALLSMPSSRKPTGAPSGTGSGGTTSARSSLSGGLFVQRRARRPAPTACEGQQPHLQGLSQSQGYSQEFSRGMSRGNALAAAASSSSLVVAHSNRGAPSPPRTPTLAPSGCNAPPPPRTPSPRRRSIAAPLCPDSPASRARPTAVATRAPFMDRAAAATAAGCHPQHLGYLVECDGAASDDSQSFGGLFLPAALPQTAARLGGAGACCVPPSPERAEVARFPYADT